MNDRLGHTYRDKISGFQGVATGHCEYITGCNQTLLQPPVGADGAPKESHWFDDQRLDFIDADRIYLNNGPTPGCDKPAPRR